MVVEDWNLPCRYLVHDRDCSFAALDPVLKTDRLTILKTPPRAPMCNAYAERHVREIRGTLDQLILLGESLCTARDAPFRNITTGNARIKGSATLFRWTLIIPPSRRPRLRCSARIAWVVS